VEIAERARDAGVSGLCIHGRTRAQGYSGGVDYRIIGKVKESLNIPVIASGDALSTNHIKKMFSETGCDGVAVARGGLGNPWIFHETAEYLKGGAAPPRPDVRQIAQTMKTHLDLLVSFRGENTGVILFRKLFTWYTKGMSVKQLRVRAFHAGTRAEMQQLIGEAEASTAG
jgi:tRNA-dihydrouridine synthase